VSLLVSSCTKSPKPEGAASLILVNAMVGTSRVITNFDDTQPLHYFSGAFQAMYGWASILNKFNSYSGTCHLSVYDYQDTAGKPVLSTVIDLPIGSSHSLLLTGTKQQPDTVFTEDKPPYFGGDSSTGMRFINLSPGSGAISINLQGQANGSVVSSLPYKGVTDFKVFPARSTVTDYVFEYRDAVSGNLIATYTAMNVGGPGQSYSANQWMFKNNTLALIGSPDSIGTYQQRILLINNF